MTATLSFRSIDGATIRSRSSVPPYESVLFLKTLAVLQPSIKPCIDNRFIFIVRGIKI